MIEFLYQLNNIYLFILLSCFAIGLSIIGIIIVRCFISHELRSKNNTVIGNISSLIGLIYGVLAGLTALYLINNISYTSDAVQHEANAAANIYRDSRWLHDPQKSEIENDIKAYLEMVVNIEWPAMRLGKNVTNDGLIYIEKISNSLVNYPLNVATDSLLLHDMLDELKSLYNARENRINMSFSSLNPSLWVVIIIGTILTIGINFLYGMNFYLQLIAVSAAALMTSSMVFLLMTLDKPFQGEFIIEPDALRSVLTTIEQSGSSAANKSNIKNLSSR